MTTKNKNQDPFNSPPPAQRQRNQGIPRRATPPPVQNNNSPATRRTRAILHRYVQNLIAANANASPGSNRSNQTPLTKKPKK